MIGTMKNLKACRMYSKKVGICLILLMTFLTGCESIPPGEPPNGAIVSVKPTDEVSLSPEVAINNMTTALATCSELYAGGDLPVVFLQPAQVFGDDKEYRMQLGHLTARLYRTLLEMEIIKFPNFSAGGRDVNFLLASTFLKKFTYSMDDEEDQPLIFKWEVKLLTAEGVPKTVWKHKVKVEVKRIDNSIKEVEQDIDLEDDG